MASYHGRKPLRDAQIQHCISMRAFRDRPAEHPFSPQRVSPKSKVWIDVIDGETKPKVKLSASLAAIERALAKKEADKRLQAQG